MGTIIIHTTNKKDVSLLQELAHKMGFKSEILTGSDREDYGMAKAIEENDPSDKLSLEEAREYYPIKIR